MVAQPQSLTALAAAPSAPAASEDKDWSGGARTAAIIAGVVGGAAIAGVVAYGAAMGGMQLGSILMGSLYREQLPRVIGLVGLLNTGNQVLLAAPIAGAVAGGLVGAIAGKKKHVEEKSQVPGSGVASKQPYQWEDTGVGARSLRSIVYAGRAVKEQFREAGEGVHEGVNGVGDAKSFMQGVSSGAHAGYAFASRIGRVGGGLMGIAEGAYLGGLLAGLPFTFAPLTAIPIAIVGAWGIGTAMSKIGGLAAGTVGGAAGAVLGGVGYGVKKAVGGDEQNP